MSLLPVCRPHQIQAQDPSTRWLIESLWCTQAVGIIGGEPKCGKSLLALELAVAVATAKPCLRHFATTTQGSVLLYNGEDSPQIIRNRLEGIAGASAVSLESLRIGVITANSLLLDRPEHQEHLDATVARYRPVLLVLDPFVRLHSGVDENAAADVSPILAYLRRLSRQHQLAITLVHHARKQSTTRARLGQSLRGSSEFHAWGDSNLYLQRKGERLLLSVEHRAAPAIERLRLRFDKISDTACALALDQTDATDCQPTPQAHAAATDTIVGVLATAIRPLSIRDLQKSCHMRTQRLCEALDTLLKAGSVSRHNDGYRLASYDNP